MAGKSFQDRELASQVRSLALTEIKKALQGKDKKFKKEILLRLSTSILPRLNEVTGKDGEKLFPTPILANVPTNDSTSQDTKS